MGDSCRLPKLHPVEFTHDSSSTVRWYNGWLYVKISAVHVCMYVRRTVLVARMSCLKKSVIQHRGYCCWTGWRQRQNVLCFRQFFVPFGVEIYGLEFARAPRHIEPVLLLLLQNNPWLTRYSVGYSEQATRCLVWYKNPIMTPSDDTANSLT